MEVISISAVRLACSQPRSGRKGSKQSSQPSTSCAVPQLMGTTSQHTMLQQAQSQALLSWSTASWDLLHLRAAAGYQASPWLDEGWGPSIWDGVCGADNETNRLKHVKRRKKKTHKRKDATAKIQLWLREA